MAKKKAITTGRTDISLELIGPDRFRTMECMARDLSKSGASHG